ncbi:MAG: AraC family transcriptional regulator [Spirochaetales bacterium]|nr:AraC family transcriptional regulator [Spirochaetales bacterium]
MSYRKRILISYLAILIISLIVNNIILYFTMNNREFSLKQEYYLGQVNQLRSTIDYLLKKINTDIVFLSFKNELRNIKEWYEKSDYRAKLNFYNNLGPFYTLADYYDEAFMIYPDDNMLIDLRNKIISTIDESRNKSKINFLMEKIIASSKNKDFFLSTTYKDSREAFLIKPLFISGIQKQIYIVFQLNDQLFKDVLDKIFLTDMSFVLVVDQYNKIIQIRSKDLDIKDEYLNSLQIIQTKAESAGTVNIMGEEFLVCFAASPDYGLKYFFGVSSKSIMKGPTDLILSIAIISFIILIIFVIVIYIVSLQLYQPVQKILNLLEKDDSQIMKDEFRTIQMNIEGLIEKNQFLRESVDQNKNYERNIFLKNLVLNGAEDLKEIKKKLDAYELDIICEPGTVYFIHACWFKDMSINHLENFSDYYFGNKNASFLQLFSFHEELHHEYFWAENNLLIFILSMKEESIKILGDKECPVNLTDEGRKILTMAVSESYASLDSLHEAYKEALITIDQRIMFKNQPVIYYRDVKVTKRKSHFYPFDIEQKLIVSIKQSDLTAVKDYFSLFAETVQKSGVSSRDLKHIFYHLLDSIIKVLKDYDIALEEIEENQDTDIWDALEKFDRSEEIVNQFLLFINRITQAIQQNKESSTFFIAQKVKSFIDQNYHDRNLSLVTITDELKYSISYLSSIFKNTYGQTIKDYITGIRLAKARELLINTNQKIIEISNQVGYDNVGSFVKIFKTYLGETPQKFRYRIVKK